MRPAAHLRAADVVLGNTYTHRALPFLGLFWLSMILTGGATVNAGWLYVGARALYPFAALAKGIKASGPQAPILLRCGPRASSGITNAFAVKECNE